MKAYFLTATSQNKSLNVTGDGQSNWPLSYIVFHLNMAFSAIEEDERPKVIERCYWPILELAEKFPIGIEATGYTLAAIAKFCPEWIEKLRGLIASGQAELVGSGAAQIIGPLVPSEVTRQNLRLGIQDYEQYVGCRPSIALVNEQAFSPGLLPLYKEAGFEAVMMDWSEAASHHPEWPSDLASRPQIVSAHGVEMPVIWSDAISFQKFQRYAHGELGPDEYFEFLALQCEKGIEALPLYTSDAEVFDYRPGRFKSEASLDSSVEFERIKALLTAIEKSGLAKLAKPGDVLTHISTPELPIKIETAAAPVTVKKQRKYNILRWALTGQNDLLLNTYCWRLFEQMLGQPAVNDNEWRHLLHCWASDFRTHITSRRWKKLQAGLQPLAIDHEPDNTSSLNEVSDAIGCRFETQGHNLIVHTGIGHLVLNSYRGMAIKAFGFGAYEGASAGAPGENSLIGTLSHGFFDDIQYGADFYSGHMVYEPSDAGKVSDLGRCEIKHSYDAATAELVFDAEVHTGLGLVKKSMRLSLVTHRLTVEYDLPDDKPRWGSLRVAHVTLNPRSFDASSLYFEAFNGGEQPERHTLCGDGHLLSIDHGKPVNKLVSASAGLGMTDGSLVLGDASRRVRLSMERTDAAGIGMVSCEPVKDSFFVRALISLGETDETARKEPEVIAAALTPVRVRYTIELEQ